jgi:hypothetical protein
MIPKIKKASKLYQLYFMKVFWSIIIFALPIQLINTFFVNYVTAPFQMFGNFLWANLIQVFLICIAFPLLQIPFISIVKQDEEEDEVSFKKIIDDFFVNGPHVYLLGVMSAVSIIVGLLLFLIPGLILGLFLLCLPQTIIIRHKKWWKAIKATFMFGKKKAGQLFIILMFFIVIDTLISSTTFFLSAGLTSSFFIINIALLFMNSFIIPLFIFTITYIYKDWEIARNEGHGQTIALLDS